MSDTLDFSGLTPAQEWLLLYQGWRVGQTYPDGKTWAQPQKRTVKKLIERGLMEPIEVKAKAGAFTITVTEYYVPTFVHAAYCSFCASREVGHA